MSELKILPGRCLLEVESQERDTYGDIIIPESVRAVKGRTGRCVGVNFYPQSQRKVKIWRGHRLVKAKPACVNDDCADILGHRVGVTDGVELAWNGKAYFIARLEHVLCVLPDDDDSRLVADDIERCRHCRSNGEGNMLMDNHGYCLRCGLNRHGQHRDQRELPSISEEDKHMFGRSAREYAAENDPHRPKETSRVYSYDGQDKRK